MKIETLFRILFILSTLAMFAIRITYQRKTAADRRGSQVKGNPLGLIPGAIAALTALIFGLEYILAPGTFGFAYLIPYPNGLRGAGAILLVAGIWLLAAAHQHLGRSFSSFVAMREDQKFVDTGPYQTVRHPIYTAYIMNYLGGGLLAGNVVLTIIPALFFALMIAFRIREEEEMLVELFGNTYIAYMERTGRFLPFF